MPNLEFLRRGSQNSKIRSRDPLTITCNLILHFWVVHRVVNLSVKIDTNIFIGDRYMAILPLRAFGCKVPIWANFGEFFGVWPPKCGQILSRPQAAHPWPKTCVLTYRSSRSAKKCDLFAWRRKQKKEKKEKRKEEKRKKKRNSEISQVTYVPRLPT